MDIGQEIQRALNFHRMGNLEEAGRIYQAVLAQVPDQVDALHLLGIIESQCGQQNEAVDRIRRAIVLAPDRAEFYSDLGEVFLAKGEFQEAITSYQNALRLSPNFATAHNNLGNALSKLGRRDEAQACFQQALRLKPDYAEAHHNLGLALMNQGHLQEASSCFQQAVRLKPDHAEAYNNLGTVFNEQGKLQEAMDCYQKALQSKSDFALAHWNHSLALLRMGDFVQGWQKHEWRWTAFPEMKRFRRDFPQPQWDGSNPQGRTILLHFEQGLGDTIQFVRYSPLLSQLGARVILECQSELKSLLRDIEGVSQILSRGEPLPAFDLHCPLMSLPLAFGTTLETIPAKIPYLRPSPEKVSFWRNRLNNEKGFKIGLVWAGNPRLNQPSANLVDRRRSMRLTQFSPLASIPGIVWVSLQKGSPSDQSRTPPQGMNLIDWTNELADFADTAALVEALDLVICVDTSVAHLAGALGKPVWVLNRFDSCWRWLLDREDSPWYPTMRLFRQPKPGDWDSVLSQLVGELSKITSPRDSRETGPELQRGLKLHQAGKLDEADRIYQAVLAQQPNHVDALQLSGIIASQRGQHSLAVERLRRAIALAPNRPEFFSDLGEACLAKGEIDKAIHCYQSAIRLDPNYATAHNNLGNALSKLGRMEEAVACLEQAFRIKPDYALAHFNYALALLRKCDFVRGWKEYEWRWSASPEMQQFRRDFQKPQWDGSNPQGRTILIHSEQGLGDAIQFVRYAPLVSQRGARVILECQPELKSFFSNIPGIDLVISRGEPLPTFDLHCPLMSLPLAFGTTLETIPAQIPYLRPIPEKVAFWRDRLKNEKGLKVGLVWAGNPRLNQPSANLVDRRRSMPLSQFSPLATVPGVVFVSLQKGSPADQSKSPPEGMKLLDWTSELRDFADTAALVEALDLVICVDTSVAHLAGALGKPVWVLNRFDSCWRWLLDRQDTPWYPTMRLFRQSKPGDWDSVLSQVSRELSSIASPLNTRETGPELQRGLKLHQAGKLDEADRIYQAVLAQQPNQVDALQLSGIIASLQGRHTQAVELIRRAIGIAPHRPQFHTNLAAALVNQGQIEEGISHYQMAIHLNPDFVEAHQNLGNLYKDQNRSDEAIHSFRQVARLKPADTEVHYSLGVLLKSQGRLEEAIACYQKAVTLNPDYAEAHNNLGNALLELGRMEEAIPFYKQALWIKPTLAETHNNLGIALMNQGKDKEAIACYREAIRLKSDFTDAHNNLGIALMNQGNQEEAIPSFRQALYLKPDFPNAHNNLGNALNEQGKPEEAITNFQQALLRKPDYTEAHNNLGNALMDQGRLEEAMISYRQALRLKPDFPDAQNNLGILLKNQGREQEAIACFREALRLRPDSAIAHFNYALTLLRMGDLSQGWKEYEWRWTAFPETIRTRRDFQQPQWDGSDPKGRTILLHSEQGLGDTIQFVRYAPLLSQLGARVILECQSELKSLLRDVEGVSQILSRGEPLPAFDLHCPLMSLPLAFGTTLDTIPAQIPYLRPIPEKVAFWRDRLKNEKGLKVGLVWAGNPRLNQPSANLVDRRRSMRLSQFSPLATVPGVVFVSLQKGSPADQSKSPPEGMKLLDWTGELRDFADTAALVSNLDRVLCVDTSVAHLAGALGKPVWVLNRFDSCWRWLLDRQDTPWYPTMRLFRQSKPGDWDSVLSQVAHALSIQV